MRLAESRALRGRVAAVVITLAISAVVGFVPVGTAVGTTLERPRGIKGASQANTIHTAATMPLYRFRNRETSAFVYTYDEDEKAALLDDPSTYSFQGVAFWIPDQAAATVPVYWFYNTDNDGDFLTTSTVERDNLLVNAPGLEYLGIGFYTIQYSPTAVLVTRLRDTVSGSHLYTTRSEEIAAAQAVAGGRYVLEGPSFYVSATGNAWDPAIGAPPPTPVYRFYNMRTGVHFYTASEAEREYVQRTFPAILRFEGVAYAINTANPANHVPLYRFYNVRMGVHFYTASEAERDYVQQAFPSILRFEGEAYRVSADPSGTPVYRLYNTFKGVHFYTASEDEKDQVLAAYPVLFRYEGAGYYLAP